MRWKPGAQVAEQTPHLVEGVYGLVDATGRDVSAQVCDHAVCAVFSVCAVFAVSRGISMLIFFVSRVLRALLQ